MSNHIWRIKKISDNEYHVVEYQHGLNSDNPYILAKCTGPVPAGDIMIAMHVQQQLKHNQQMLEGLAKCNFVKSAAELASILKKWHTLDYPALQPTPREETK